MVYTVPVKGVFVTNCYFCIDEDSGHGFLIDPAAEADRLFDVIEKYHWKIEKILLTHGHFDHFEAADRLREKLKCPILTYNLSDKYLSSPEMNLSLFCGCSMKLENTVKCYDGDKIDLENNSGYNLKIIETPGHTEDSMALYCEKEKAAFVGDTIFKGQMGTSQYPGGNQKNLMESIGEKILKFPEETTLYSGHSEKTTVKNEKKFYMF